MVKSYLSRRAEATKELRRERREVIDSMTTLMLLIRSKYGRWNSRVPRPEQKKYVSL